MSSLQSQSLSAVTLVSPVYGVVLPPSLRELGRALLVYPYSLRRLWTHKWVRTSADELAMQLSPEDAYLSCESHLPSCFNAGLGNTPADTDDRL